MFGIEFDNFKSIRSKLIIEFKLITSSHLADHLQLQFSGYFDHEFLRLASKPTFAFIRNKSQKDLYVVLLEIKLHYELSHTGVTKIDN